MGVLTQESADHYIEFCVIEPLQRAKRVDLSTKEEMPAARVEVVDTLVQAEERLARGGVDVVVFNSRSLIGFARDLKKRYRHVMIFVLTGLIPKDEIMLVDKAWVRLQMVEDIFLNTQQGL